MGDIMTTTYHGTHHTNQYSHKISTERRVDAVSRIFDIATRLMFEPGSLVAIEAWSLLGQSRA